MSKNKQNSTYDLIYSPNFYSKKRRKKDIKQVVLHYTGMKNELAAIRKLTSIKSAVSCNYFIKSNGKIIQIVPDLYSSWHAGISAWKNFKFLNKSSIGIEIQNPGHHYKYLNFTNKQIKSIVKLLKVLIKKYNIKKKFILGHSDISPDRKKDPGEKFPWKLLSKHNLGIWHNLNQDRIKKMRKAQLDEIEEKRFINFLKKIGYKSKNNKNIILSFQRRFRPNKVNGISDKECFFIAKSLLKRGL